MRQTDPVAARHCRSPGPPCHASDDAAIEAAFAAFIEQRVGARTFAADTVFNSRRNRIVALAARHALPAMYFIHDFADARLFAPGETTLALPAEI